MIRKRVVILISGRGSNMARLIEAAHDRDFPAEIVGVISDVPDAPGLHHAENLGIPARPLPREDHASRQAHDDAIHAELLALDAELVCLAGYMRLLSAEFVERWQGRMINIHPALLPSFRGLDTHRKALDSGVLVHGCTVHFVTAAMDSGPIIAQAAVPVIPGDTEHQLAARVLKAEHELYPMALRLVVEGRARMVGGSTEFGDLHLDGRASRARLFSPATSEGAADFEALARVTP